jgi:hypothetical protein
MFSCMAFHAIHAAKTVPAAPNRAPINDLDSTGAKRKIRKQLVATAVARMRKTTTPSNNMCDLPES